MKPIKEMYAAPESGTLSLSCEKIPIFAICSACSEKKFIPMEDEVLEAVK